jgi:hypothetical protein
MSDWFRGLAELKGNGLIAFNRELFKAALRRHEGKAVLILRPVEEFRTPAQNRYYWGVIIPVLNAHPLFKAWTEEQLHDGIKEKFLSELDPATGLTKVGSTKELKKSGEFSAFKEAIQQWAAEKLDIYIPDPNEDLEAA